MGSFIKSLNEKQIAFIIIFLITIVYLFPIFLGKVDTASDIRDVRMYPWRYHSVDKKIKLITLYKQNDPSVFNLITPPGGSSNTFFKIYLDTQLSNKLGKLSDSITI